MLNIGRICRPPAFKEIPDTFFKPYVAYHTKEILEIGGSAWQYKENNTTIGIYIYDKFERTGTVYTKSLQVLDTCCKMQKSGIMWSELDIKEHKKEQYNIFTRSLDLPIEHKFKHAVTLCSNPEAIQKFMLWGFPLMNRKWVDVALKNGDRCLSVAINDQLAGVGWVSVVNRIGRLHSLYVDPQYRNMGIGGDILCARLLWLQTHNCTRVFSEISCSNMASSAIARKNNMSPAAQVYQYQVT